MNPGGHVYPARTAQPQRALRGPSREGWHGVGDKAERLVNLTVALLETRRPLTFAEIRRRTGFYTQRDHESGRRMFERDKDDLRRLGVPVVVTDVAFGEELGYRIDRRDYELPDIDLTAEEVTALAIAVHLTGGEGVKLALTKLLARAPDPVPAGAPPPVRVEVAADAVDAVAAAVVTRTALRFRYRAADGTVTDREVDPYAVVQRRGSWYLAARDHDRDALRAFRLDRIQGAPRPFGDPGAFETPEDLDVAAAVSGPELAAVEVELAVDAATRWAVESRGGSATGRMEGGRAVLRVPGIDPARDRAWLLGLAPGAEVLGPQEVVDEVTRGLREVLAAHGGTEPSEERIDPGGRP